MKKIKECKKQCANYYTCIRDSEFGVYHCEDFTPYDNVEEKVKMRKENQKFKEQNYK